MDGDRNRILIESIRRLLRRGAGSNLRKIVNKTHAADLTSVFHSLPLPDQRRLFDVLKDPEQKGELFSRLEVDIFLNLVK